MLGILGEGKEMSLVAKKTSMWIASVALFVAFALLSAPTAFGQAAGEPLDEYVGLSGVVIESSESGTATSVAADGTGVLVINDADEGEFVVALGSDYTLRTPGSETPSDVAGVLAVGAKVAVLAQSSAGGDLTAVQVLVKPVRPTTEPVTGAVVSRSGNTITIQRPDGTTKTVELPSGAPVPEEGDLVTAFVPERGQASAKGLVRAQEISQRLNAHLNEQLEELGSSDLSERERETVEERLARVASLFEQHSTKRVDALQRVLDSGRLPEAARTRVETALGRAQAGFDQAMSAAASARDRAGLPEGAGRPGDTSTDIRPEGSGAAPTATPSGRPSATPTRPAGR